MLGHFRLMRAVLNQSRAWFPNNIHHNIPQRVATFRQYSIVKPPAPPVTSTPPTPTTQPATITEQSNEDFLKSLSEENRKRLLEIKVELSVMFEDGEKACDPDLVTPSQWRYILTLGSPAQRRREFQHIGRKHYYMEKELREKEERAIEGAKCRTEIRKERQEEPHIVYGLGHTSLVMRINADTMTRFYNSRLWRAKIFNAQKIVFDFGYDDYMIKKFCHYTASHFKYFYSSNRKNQLPFDVHICNANIDRFTFQHLKRIMPNILNSDCPVDVRPECFSESYPHKDLVYLTPYSPHVLTEHNPNDVYVVGAVVDYGYHGPITMARAKKLGIRTAWPPVSRYVVSGKWSKNLPLNIVGNIMLDYKNTRDWNQALEHIPKRLRRQPRQERHMLHKIIGEVSDTKSEMPRDSWTSVRDETRRLDDVKIRGASRPFKRPTDAESDAQRTVASGPTKLDPFD